MERQRDEGLFREERKVFRNPERIENAAGGFESMR